MTKFSPEKATAWQAAGNVHGGVDHVPSSVSHPAIVERSRGRDSGHSHPTPESKKWSPKVNFPSRQWFSKVDIVARYAFG